MRGRPNTRTLIILDYGIQELIQCLMNCPAVKINFLFNKFLTGTELQGTPSITIHLFME